MASDNSSMISVLETFSIDFAHYFRLHYTDIYIKTLGMCSINMAINNKRHWKRPQCFLLKFLLQSLEFLIPTELSFFLTCLSMLLITALHLGS